MKIEENIQATENTLDLSFEQWLDHFNKEPTSKEIDDMEKRSVNNINYQPKQGA